MPVLAVAGAGGVAVRAAVRIYSKYAIVRKGVERVGLIAIVIARAAGHRRLRRWVEQTRIHRRRATAAILRPLTDHIIWAVCLLQQIQYRGAVAGGLGWDHFIRRVEAAL